MNGKSVEDPWTMEVKQGDRLRLRLINGSTATFFRVQLEDHEMEIITADGQPVVPTKAGNVMLAIAERYDVLVTIRKSGSFTLNAVALGTTRRVAGVLRPAREGGPIHFGLRVQRYILRAEYSEIVHKAQANPFYHLFFLLVSF